MKAAAHFIFFLFVLALFSACEKEPVADADAGTGTVTALECENDVAPVGTILLSDNSVIVVCRTLDEMAPGYLYKVDSKGNRVWEKRLNEQNKGCYQVCDLPGNGFAVLGYDNLYNDGFFMVFVYDDDGNFVSSKSIPFNYHPWYTVQYFPAMQMHRLNNGNFVFAINDGIMLLYITNSSFDTLCTKQIPLEIGGTYVRGICQNTDSTILFANAAASGDFVSFQWDYDVHLVQTDLNGNLISSDSIADASYNETPNSLLSLGNKMLLVTGGMGKFNESNGAMVNYVNSGLTLMISGDINLVQLSSEGGVISRQKIHDYPANGMILNARPTSDGGFVLCGTVNQANEVNLVSPARIYMMKVSAGGAFEWSKTINTVYPTFGAEAVQTSDGGYFICGYQKVFDKRYNTLVIKTDANGNF